MLVFLLHCCVADWSNSFQVKLKAMKSHEGQAEKLGKLAQDLANQDIEASETLESIQQDLTDFTTRWQNTFTKIGKSLKAGFSSFLFNTAWMQG